MSTVLSCKVGVLNRKPRNCCLCGDLIKSGEIKSVRKGVDGGDFWSMHMHKECNFYEVYGNVVDQDDYERCDFGGFFERSDAIKFTEKNEHLDRSMILNSGNKGDFC